MVGHALPQAVVAEAPSRSERSPPPDFQLTLAKASTPSSLVIPESSPRYKALKSVPGAVIEISPEAQSYAAAFARRIGGLQGPTSRSRGYDGSREEPLRSSKSRPSGAALILDYGSADTIPTSTLRGIRRHRLVSPFSLPGQVDISADVDFTALAEAAIDASPGVEVHGPVEQGKWLEAMGIRERSEMLCRNLAVGDVEGRKRIMAGVERLVERGGGGMGRLYKVMAIVPEGGGERRPVGFGGVVREET
jgi:NADH dehydrogenase [ubiquinone] 1 alpha subcomplex assembly factor 7